MGSDDFFCFGAKRKVGEDYVALFAEKEAGECEIDAWNLVSQLVELLLMKAWDCVPDPAPVMMAVLPESEMAMS